MLSSSVYVSCDCDLISPFKNANLFILTIVILKQHTGELHPHSSEYVIHCTVYQKCIMVNTILSCALVLLLFRNVYATMPGKCGAMKQFDRGQSGEWSGGGGTGI